MIQYLFMSNEQTHPLHITDKNIIDSLITKDKPEDIDFIQERLNTDMNQYYNTQTGFGTSNSTDDHNSLEYDRNSKIRASRRKTKIIVPN